MNEHRTAGRDPTDSAKRMRTLSKTGTEMLFVLLPFIVIAGVHLSKGAALRVFYASEWSFAAVVLSGQTLLKFSSGFLSRGEALHREKVTLVMAVLIVLVLVPSVLLLLFVLISDPLPAGLAVMQMVWFSITFVLFAILGTLGESLT